MLPLVVLVVATGPWLLGFFGEGFASAYPLLVVLTLGSLVRSLCGPAPGILLTTGHERLYSWLVSIATLSRLAITAMLATRYGAFGAGVGWAMGAAPFAIALALICRSRCGVDPSVGALWPRRSARQDYCSSASMMPPDKAVPNTPARLGPMA